MNHKVEPHKSSILDADANLVALSVYLLPLLGNFMSLGIISWVLPVVAIFLEKNSPLVFFHAVQSLVLQAVVLVFNVLMILFGFVSAGSSLVLGNNIFGAFGVVGIVGVISTAITVIVVAFEIVGIVKAYGWEIYYFPFFGEFTKKFTNKQ